MIETPARHRRPSRVWIALLVLAAALLAAACGSDGDVAAEPEVSLPSDTTVSTSVPAPDPDEPPIDAEDLVDPNDPRVDSPDLPACVEEDWYAVEAGEFSYFVPGDFVDQRVQGIDSLVLQHTRPGMSVTADVGWFGSSFDELIELGATAEPITIADHEGLIVTADLRDHPDYGGGFVVGVYLAPAGAGGAGNVDVDPDGVAEDRAVPEPQPDPATHLTLSINHDDEVDAADAACIAASVGVV